MNSFVLMACSVCGLGRGSQLAPLLPAMIALPYLVSLVAWSLLRRSGR